MKKMLAIVMAMVFVLGFAGVAFAMGPDGADPATVGFVLTDFGVSDTILSPLMIMNWSGTLTPSKTYAEGQPIWFVAHYVQNKLSAGDVRNFASGLPAASLTNISQLTTVFSSKDNCVNFSYSSGYMNFVEVNGLNVYGGTVGNLGIVPATGAISTSNDKLEVTMVAAPLVGSATSLSSADIIQLKVANAQPTVAGNYYLQIMAFTRACTEAQGTVYAKTPIDYNEFDNSPGNIKTVTATGQANLANLLAANPNPGQWLNLYDGGAEKYRVVKYNLDFPINNIGAVAGDSLYMVYGTDNEQIIGFVSSSLAYRGMVKVTATPSNALQPVQYTSDSGGKYAFSDGTGVKAIETGDLQALMTFLNFSFANNYPVLDKHFNAFAGYWKTLTAYYNVAAAVIDVPDQPVDIVPKTGDVASSMGLIMVAIALAGLAAVGFVVSKRVHN